MFDNWFNVPAHFYLRVIALSIIAVGVSTSNVFMSIGTIWLLANWLLEGGFTAKLKRLKTTPVLWIFLFIFFFGLLSLIWSEDVNYGIHDLRIKLPLLVIPIVLGTSTPLPKKYFYLILKIFLAVLVGTSIWNYIKFNSQIEGYYDIRQMSRFISHVRYSILINFGIFFTYYFLLKRKLSVLIVIPIMLWLLYYQYKSQVVNGYVLLLLLSILSISYWIFSIKQRNYKYVFASVFSGLALLAVFGTAYIWQNASINIPKVDYSQLDLYTANHNGYYHQKNTKITEDGKLVYLYISEKECRRAWTKRSSVHFDSLDRKGHPIVGTIYRYMTSKDLRKDSIGFLSLTDQDIKNIENGFSNYKTNRGLVEKVSDLKMQFFLLKSHGDPNGNSLIQRQLHLQAAAGILRENWLFGVGIGDVQKSFLKEYEKRQSLLRAENQHRSHNQFLTLWISHGIIGFVALVLLWILPIYQSFKTCNYLLCVVLIAFGFSFLWQDMLETQAGVTIFALFYSLMVFKSRKNVAN